MKTIKLAFIIALGMFMTIQAEAQCPPSPPGCGTWGLENTTGCDLDFVWETPPPCVVTQGAGTLYANTPITPWPAPCIQAGDCGYKCPWALRLIDPPNPGYVFYGNGIANTYFNVIQCASCSSGWIKATYIPMPGSIPNHVLKFECQP